MAFDLGDVVPLSIEIRDSNGLLANAGSMKLTITLPDGTVDTTDPVTSTSTGIYDHDYATAQAGRHVARWLATGLNSGAYVDTFDVREADPGYIVSLADAKTQLNITGTTNDEELRSFVEATTWVVENDPEVGVGAVVRRTYTETHDGISVIRLRHAPVLSVTTVKESGTTLTTTQWQLRGSEHPRLIRLGSQYTPSCFVWGAGNIEVTYIAGRTVVPPNVTRAAAIIIQHLWETQRAGGSRPPAALAGEMVAVSDQFGRSFSIPLRAVELLRASRQLMYA